MTTNTLAARWETDPRWRFPSHPVALQLQQLGHPLVAHETRDEAQDAARTIHDLTGYLPPVAEVPTSPEDFNGPRLRQEAEAVEALRTLVALHYTEGDLLGLVRVAIERTQPDRLS